MKEYEFNGTFEIDFTGESLGKLKFSEIRKKLQKEFEKFLEENDAISQYDIYDSDFDIDYEKLE